MLKPAERLRKDREFRAVFRAGKRYSGPYLLLVVASNKAAGARLGIVAKKTLGKANRRNLIRRRIVEAYRKFKPQIRDKVDIVIVPRAEIGELPFSALQGALAEHLARARLLKATA